VRLPYIQGLDPVFQKELDRVFAVYDARINYLEDRLESVERRPIASDSSWTPANLTQEYDLVAAVVLTTSDLNQVHLVNCTVASDMTLPTGYTGAWIEIQNRGTAAITVKNAAAATIATVKQYQRAHIPALQNSSGADVWPTVVPVSGSSGETYTLTDVILRDDTKGIQWKDSAGHWWRATIATTGALTTADLGTTESAPNEPVL